MAKCLTISLITNRKIPMPMEFIGIIPLCVVLAFVAYLIIISHHEAYLCDSPKEKWFKLIWAVYAVVAALSLFPFLAYILHEKQYVETGRYSAASVNGVDLIVVDGKIVNLNETLNMDIEPGTIIVEKKEKPQFGIVTTFYPSYYVSKE